MSCWKPDFKRLDKVLRRSGEPDILPFYELFADLDVMEQVIGKPVTDKTTPEYYHRMGFDYSVTWLYLHFGQVEHEIDEKSSVREGKRRFFSTQEGIIKNRSDYEKFDWPVFNLQHSGYLNYAAGFLPEGMKLVIDARGIFEYATFLTGLVNFSYLLYDDEPLVSEIFDRIGSEVIRMFRVCLNNCDMKNIGAFALCDDLAYDHGTLVNPQVLRKYVFPWYKEVSELIHSYDIPLILHSCGNLEAIMDELIDNANIDAIHSFQDKIYSVREAKRRWGDRITLLGGVDIDFLCKANPDQMKQYVDETISVCSVNGGYAFGSGNSVANYIPMKNYINMLKCARSGFKPDLGRI